VDGANVARDFLRSRGIAEQDIETVWTAIALHTTPGIPQHMHPVIARTRAPAASSKGSSTPYDVLADKDPSFRPENFCRVIRAHAWPG
jgi:hypothetical protein